ncbi:Metal-dependent protein hydrolase [Perilla frutescens var. frutescens]|nr:Metal-dependent protein hydrolase [Perilla frutescens var. frutescens]
MGAVEKEMINGSSQITRTSSQNADEAQGTTDDSEADDPVVERRVLRSKLISAFAIKGLNARDMVALSGSHTIGQAQCVLFRDRIYSNGTDVDSGFATIRRRRCPRNGGDSNLHFGKEIIAKELQVDEDHPDVQRLFLAIYKNFMKAIDAIDNGINQYDTDQPPRYVNNTLSSRVGKLNLDWTDSDQSSEKENEAFERAMALAGHEFMEVGL